MILNRRAHKTAMTGNPAHEDEDEISLYDVAIVLWAQRWIIVSITVVATIVAGVAALVIDKKYQAAVVVSPVSSSASNSQLGAVSSLASQFGGLASLAGVSVSGDSKKSESLAVLQSEALTEGYIQKNDLLPILYQKQWDPIGKKWKESAPERTPTLWKANQYFKREVRSLVTDAKTGLVTLTITWKDARLAATWANELVRMTNDYLRDQAIQESERNIAYLNDQASKTDALGAKQAIYALLQNEINKVMLARGNSEYALKVVDPAFIPELPSSPKLSLWLLSGLFGGFFAALFVAFVRSAWRSGHPKQ